MESILAEKAPSQSKDERIAMSTEWQKYDLFKIEEYNFEEGGGLSQMIQDSSLNVSPQV